MRRADWAVTANGVVGQGSAVPGGSVTLHTPRRTVAVLVALLAVVAAVVAGCGGKSKPKAQTSQTEETVPLVSESPTSAGPATPADRTVNKTGWFAGFAITVGKVSAKPSGTDMANLSLALNYENLGAATATPPGDTYAHLEIAGHSISIDFQNPNVDPKAKAPGTATASVDLREIATPAPTSSADASGNSTAGPYDFLTQIRSVYPTASAGATVPTVPGDTESTPAVPLVTDLGKMLDQAVLVYGDPADNQTRIPFAANAKVSSYAPKNLPLGVTLGHTTVVNLVSATLSPSYQLGDHGKFELRVFFGATCSDAKACGKYGFSLAQDNFVLGLPDGTKVKPDFRSEWCCSPVAPDKPLNGPKTDILFVFPGPPTGGLTFTYTEPKGSAESYTINAS